MPITAEQKEFIEDVAEKLIDVATSYSSQTVKHFVPQIATFVCEKASGGVSAVREPECSVIEIILRESFGSDGHGVLRAPREIVLYLMNECGLERPIGFAIIATMESIEPRCALALVPMGNK